MTQVHQMWKPKEPGTHGPLGLEYDTISSSGRMTTSGNFAQDSCDPWVGKTPGERSGNPLQYPFLENSMDRGAWWVTVHGVTKSQARLSG